MNRKFLVVPAVVTLFAFVATANERILTNLTLSGSKATNVQGLADGGVAGTPISPASLLTIQPTVDAYVCVGQLDSAGIPNCTSLNGLRVPANAALPTSCPSSTNAKLPVLLGDGGTVYVNTSSCIVEVVQVADAGSAKVMSRLGTEF